MRRHRVLLFGLALLSGGCAQQEDAAPPAGPPPPAVDLPTRAPAPPPGPQARASPPISGGTLMIAADGHTAVAADPPRDRILVVDLRSRALLRQIDLEPGDEPGRVVQDGAGRVHAILRGAGALLSFDLTGAAPPERRRVCTAPRGLGRDGDGVVLHVACAGGELVSLPAAGGAPLRSLLLDRDLRDVVGLPDRLVVSRFRAAEVLQVGPGGTVLDRIGLPAFEDHAAGVAWRMVGLPGGRLALVHQRALSGILQPRVEGYYTPSDKSACRQAGVVQSTVTIVVPGLTPPISMPLPSAVLPVDVAASSDGSRLAIVAAGSGRVLEVAAADLTSPSPRCVPVTDLHVPARFPSAVAYDGDGRIVVQDFEPPALYVQQDPQSIPLPGGAPADRGTRLFHTTAPTAIACASCHPEGAEDGHVWQFPGIGKRRTQSLRGGLLATAPFHWDGDRKTFEELLRDVLVSRMQGTLPAPDEMSALAGWLDRQQAPAPSPPTDPAGVDRGRALFFSEDLGCATCHAGPHLTSGQSADVGTGGKFQVPSLRGLWARAPYLHDGCAATLRERFSDCGGGQRHGRVWILSAGDLGDLLAFLETL